MFIKIKEWRLSGTSGKDEYDVLILFYIFYMKRILWCIILIKKRLEELKSEYRNVVNRLD